jgi:CheY-like chemotaxis protein/two-component sensor histidine kinase
MGAINKKQKETLLVAQDNLHRLSMIINQMLDIAKIESGKMEICKKKINLVELVQKTIDIFKSKIEKKGLQLRIVSLKKMMIFADPDKISQVMINLISNSIKFTDTGTIEVSIKLLNSSILCSVSDTGIGIAKKDLPYVFDKFQQFERKIGPKEKGTGLGLAICKAIITLHKGTIWIESDKGKGTKVIFTLPKRSNGKNKKPNLINNIRIMKKILIIDDEPDWIKVLMPRLEYEGYDVVVAFDTVTGIRQIRATMPDLILLDIMMPAGGGMKVLEYVRNNVKSFNVRIVVITARSDQVTRREAEKLGISDYFIKPIDMPVVLGRIKEILFPSKKSDES